MRILYTFSMVFVLFFLMMVSTATWAYSGSLEVVEIEDTSIGLQWDEDAEADSFIVYYDYKDTLDAVNPQYFQQSDPVTETKIRIQDLDPDTHYSFVVVAVDESGYESEETSNQVTVKTFASRPKFSLADTYIQVPESKKVIARFTNVFDLTKSHKIRIIDMDSANQKDVLVKGYLPGGDDLRNLQIFLSEPLRHKGKYRLEVVDLLNTRGQSIGPEEIRKKEFEALYPLTPDVATQGGLESAGPSNQVNNSNFGKPVPIDALPTTGFGLYGLILLILIASVGGYRYIHVRKTY